MMPVMSFQTAFKYLALLFVLQIVISFVFYVSPGTYQVKHNVTSSSANQARPTFDEQQLDKLFSFFHAKHNESLNLIKSLKDNQLNQTIPTTKKRHDFNKYLHFIYGQANKKTDILLLKSRYWIIQYILGFVGRKFDVDSIYGKEDGLKSTLNTS